MKSTFHPDVVPPYQLASDRHRCLTWAISCSRYKTWLQLNSCYLGVLLASITILCE